MDINALMDNIRTTVGFTQMLPMRISFPFIHYFMPSKKWGLVFSETNSFRQCGYLVQHCPINAMANVLYWHQRLVRV